MQNFTGQGSRLEPLEILDEESIMSTTLSSGMIGVPDFKVVDIDPISVAKALQTYVSRGSRLTGVSLDDLSLGVTSIPGNIANITLVELLSLGVKLFDATVWLSAGKPATHPLSVDPSMSKDKVPSMHEIARSVFYTYFFLLTQARYPTGRNEQNPPKTPNFLKQLMGMDKEQSYYIEMICSFTPQKFDPAWVKEIEFAGLGQEVLSRFGLGVAGYRMFGPFKTHTPKKPVPDHLKNAYAFARKLATSPATWDIHPLTRSPAVLSKRGNLNKNLSNLIIEIFDDEEIKEMTSVKIIFKIPEKEAAYRDYLTWGAEDDISGTNRIFR
jgi:hypothetical protein